MSVDIEKTCPECGSTEVASGELSENIFGVVTVTFACLDCGNTWEVDYGA
jgi:hypothetical protein